MLRVILFLLLIFLIPPAYSTSIFDLNLSSWWTGKAYNSSLILDNTTKNNLSITFGCSGSPSIGCLELTTGQNCTHYGCTEGLCTGDLACESLDEGTCLGYAGACFWECADCVGEPVCDAGDEISCLMQGLACAWDGFSCYANLACTDLGCGTCLEQTGCSEYYICRDYTNCNPFNEEECTTFGAIGCSWDSVACTGTLSCTSQYLDTEKCLNISGCSPTVSCNTTATGKYGEGVNCTGIYPSYLRNTDAPTTDIGWNWTIMAWIKTASRAGAIISKVKPSYDSGYMITYGNKVTDLVCSSYQGGFANRCDLYSGNGITDNTWHHITCRHNSTNLTWFIDGVQNTSMGCNKSTGNANGYTLYVGSRYDTITHWNGTLDDLFIFNRSLSNTEINQIMGGDYGLETDTDCWILDNIKHLLIIPPNCNILAGLFTNGLLII